MRNSRGHKSFHLRGLRLKQLKVETTSIFRWIVMSARDCAAKESLVNVMGESILKKEGIPEPNGPCKLPGKGGATLPLEKFHVEENIRKFAMTGLLLSLIRVVTFETRMLSLIPVLHVSEEN
ncbi:uncharacterized protein LOC130738053 [Lotus japonicus]|uniref:uncharacterized protein LOC130738053 n=1 Tax=Lotus japonicus TaxID=34305 RepID=UPI002588BD0B|nr:uncharacterized protein LOC130738053 [Lotus japonicus]